MVFIQYTPFASLFAVGIIPDLSRSVLTKSVGESVPAINVVIVNTVAEIALIV